jgi:hypothetical protein
MNIIMEFNFIAYSKMIFLAHVFDPFMYGYESFADLQARGEIHLQFEVIATYKYKTLKLLWKI